MFIATESQNMRETIPGIKVFGSNNSNGGMITNTVRFRMYDDTILKRIEACYRDRLG